MAFTLSTADTELAARGLDYVTAARRKQALQDAMHEICEAYDWSWLIATATGAAPLTISALRTVLHVRDTDADVVLAPLSTADNLDLDPLETTRTRPTHWHRSAETIISTYPKSTANLSVRYIKVPTDLGDSDEPLIPDRHHSLWVTLAQCLLYERDSDETQQGAQLRAVVSARLAQMIAVDADVNHDQPIAPLLTSPQDF